MKSTTSTLQIAAQVEEQIQSLFRSIDSDSPLSKLLQLHLESLEENVAYLKNDDHGIVFIGSVGVGKTTAICNLLGLVDDKSEACLSTSSGRTTLCEVEIRSANRTRILIDPLDHEQVKLFLVDFVDMVKLRHEGKTAKDGENLDLPSELDRCLRNMLELTVLRKQMESPSKKKKYEKTDKALELFKELGSEEAFLDHCIEKLNLTGRTATELEPAEEDALPWIKDTFGQINHGRHQTAPLPKRIIIELETSALKREGLNIRVIDTKGLDGNVEREDIDRHLNNPRNIAILCSKFNDAPEQATRQLLQHMLDSGMKAQLETRTVLLCLDRNDEAEKVMAENGIVEDSEEGRAVREEQIEDIFRSQLRLDQHLSPGVMFFNATCDDHEESGDILIAYLQRMRNERANRIKQIREAVIEIEKHRHQVEARAAFEHVANAIHAWAQTSREQNAEFRELYKPLVEDMTSKEIYASSLRASVNRSGIWSNFDFYYKLSVAARKKSVTAFESSIGEIAKVLENHQKQANLRGAHGFIRQLLHTVEDEMQRLYENAAHLGRKAFEDQLKGDPMFWANQRGEWGQGPGYKGRIAQSTEAWFHRHNPAVAEAIIQQATMEQWISFIKRIESLLMRQAAV